MNATTQDRVRAHGEALQRLFPATRALDPVTLFRKLRRLECKLSRMNARECSYEMTERQAEDFQREYERACERVKDILWGKAASHSPDDVPQIRFNGDPRGYALKISDRWMSAHRDDAHGIPQDWGGYGLIAPDLRNA